MRYQVKQNEKGAWGVWDNRVQMWASFLAYETKEKALEILRNVYDTDETTDHFTGETTKEGRVR